MTDDQAPMTSENAVTVEALKTCCGDVSTSEFRGDTRVVVGKGKLLEAMRLLKEGRGFDLLVDVTCVEGVAGSHYEVPNRFVTLALQKQHVPVLWWYSDWARHGWPHMPMLLAAAVYFVIVTALSAAAFRFIEMPANRWMRTCVDRRLTRESEPLSVLAAA